MAIIKKIVLAILILLLPVQAWGACSGSSPTLTAASASQADIKACIDIAVDGDTVNVPAGTQTWSTNYTCGDGHDHGMCITKGIKLKGAGSGSTVLTRTAGSAYDNFLYIAPSAGTISGDYPIEVSGFTFDGNEVAMQTGAINVWMGTSTTPITKLKIYDNVFKDMPYHATYGSSRGIYVTGLVYGVIYHNEFDRLVQVLGVWGNNLTAWANSSPDYGSANNLYFEDNYIHVSSACTYGGSAACAGSTESGQGGKMVLRYNTWDFSEGYAKNDTIWDVHGLQSMKTTAGTDCQSPGGCNPTYANAVAKVYCKEYSTMVHESYGNKIVGRTDGWNGINWYYFRGGKSLWFNNKLTTTETKVPTTVWLNYACDSCQSESATKYTQHINNTYQWNTFSDSTRMSITKGSFDMCGEEYYCNSTTYPTEHYDITEDTDFFSDKYASYDGTSGVSCGTTLPATCTAGKTGFWKTTQSCTDISTFIGADGVASQTRTTKIDGELYICATDNVWSLYYTPYGYPHAALRPTSSGAANPSFKLGTGAGFKHSGAGFKLQ